jgi:hypothetical protein
MANFVIVTNNIVHNIIIAESLEIAQDCYPNMECYPAEADVAYTVGNKWDESLD